ncbi:MAG: acyltransferase [Desulfobacterales bacterium]|nr:acyltransferase [Desulfobacterales bacterium]
MGLSSLKNIFRAIALLRYPELLAYLGERRFEMLELKRIRHHFPTAVLSDHLELCAYQRELLILGEKVSIGRGTTLSFGDDSNGYGRITIGRGTWIGQYNNIRACEDGPVTIGAHCLISQFCSLVGSDHAMEKERLIIEQGADRSRLGVTLADDVWLGAGVTVMPGVTLGTGAVAGANSVVLESVPAYEIWAGSPARKIGERK